MKKTIYLLLLLFSAITFFLIYRLSMMRVVVDFKDLEPFKHSVPVYYKGFKLGRTSNIYPSPDYTSTRVDLRIRLKGLEFPENTTAIVRRKDKHDYIELLYPDAPHLVKLRNNSIIKGEKGHSFESFLQESSENGDIYVIRENFYNTLKNAGETFEALTGMIQIATDILTEIKPSITESFENINETTNNLKNASRSLDNSLENGLIDKSLSNINRTTTNLVSATESMSGFSDNINLNTTKYLNCLLNNLNILTCNINQIVIGIGNTLKKRLGGMRLFFGKAIG